MPAYWESGAAATALYWENAAAATTAYWENETTPFFTTGGPGITAFGASAGSGTFNVLTLNATQIPSSPTVRATLTGSATGRTWTIDRVLPSGQRHQVAAGRTAQVHYREDMTATFHPMATGWRYVLTATNRDGTHHAQCTIRVVTAPTLTAFAATPPASASAPFVNRQCSWLTWTATAGDPAATWSMVQSGRYIAALPSSRRLAPSFGAATGNDRQRVCVAVGSGGSTTLTLTGQNEAGNATRTLSIHWS